MTFFICRQNIYFDYIQSSTSEVQTKFTSTLRSMPRPPKGKDEKEAADLFAAALVRLRKDRGFTQVELAEMTRSVQALISDYARGRARPNADMIVRLSRALDVSADELLGIAEPTSTQSPTTNRRLLRRLKKIDSLSKRDQEALLRTIDAFLSKSAS